MCVGVVVRIDSKPMALSEEFVVGLNLKAKLAVLSPCAVGYLFVAMTMSFAGAYSHGGERSRGEEHVRIAGTKVLLYMEA